MDNDYINKTLKQHISMLKRPFKNEIEVDENKFSIVFPEVNSPVDMTGKLAKRYDNILKFNYFFANFGDYFDETRNSELAMNGDDEQLYQNISRITLNTELRQAFEDIKHFANLPNGEKSVFNKRSIEK